MSDQEKIQAYTIMVFTENLPGLLTEVVSVFTRIKMNIDTLVTSASRIKGIHRFTMTVQCTEKSVNKIVAQLEKKIDIVAAFAYLSEEVVAREVGMFKVDPKIIIDDSSKQELMDLHNPAIVEQHEDYAVLIKTGKESTVNAMHDYLKPKDCIFEFVRSGCVAVVRAMDPFNKRLDSMDKEFH